MRRRAMDAACEARPRRDRPAQKGGRFRRTADALREAQKACQPRRKSDSGLRRRFFGAILLHFALLHCSLSENFNVNLKDGLKIMAFATQVI